MKRDSILKEKLSNRRFMHNLTYWRYKMRKSYSAEFKAKVALEAVKEESTINEIASKYELHPNQVITWKKTFNENLSQLFIDKRTRKGRKEKEKENNSDMLFKKIGELQVENEFLRKKYKQIFGKDPD
jgi:transposase-like protein